MELVKISIFILTAGFGWAVIAYAGYAQPRGWSVGSWLASDFSWLQGLAYLAIVASITVSIYTGAWWHAFVVIIFANLLVRTLFPLCGPKSQIYSTVGVLIGIPVTLVTLIL